MGVAEIIHSSDTITAQTVVIVLKRNCKFEPVVHKLGRLKRTVKDIGELMNIVIKYAESDKTKDAEPQQAKAGQNKNGGKTSQNQSQQTKRRLDQTTSDLVAKTNVGSQTQKHGGNNYRKPEGNFRPNNFEVAMKIPCPTHSKPGRPANHTWEDCYFMKEFARRGNQGPPGSGGGADQNGNNQNLGHQGAGTKPQHQGSQQNQSGLAGFQANPKQLHDRASYHVFTTSSCKRDRKLQRRAAMAVTTEPAWPRWLNCSEEPITWTRNDHPPVVENPRALALVVSPQIGGYTLDKVLMDGGSSINILYYETFRRMGLTQKQLQPSNTVFHGIVASKPARPVGKIYLETAFGNAENFRSELIPFEVVKLESPYHAILGRPSYAKFMARPCYVY